MKVCIMLATLVAGLSVASADTWKLGQQKWEIHGCATDRAAKFLDDFVKRDPAFVMNGKRATLVESRPWQDGVKETSWPATIVLENGLAEWAMPRNADTHQQVRIKVDVTPFRWTSDGKPMIHVELVVDYDPKNTGTHQNVCAEQWYGQAVRL